MAEIFLAELDVGQQTTPVYEESSAAIDLATGLTGNANSQSTYCGTIRSCAVSW